MREMKITETETTIRKLAFLHQRGIILCINKKKPSWSLNFICAVHLKILNRNPKLRSFMGQLKISTRSSQTLTPLSFSEMIATIIGPLSIKEAMTTTIPRTRGKKARMFDILVYDGYGKA